MFIMKLVLACGPTMCQHAEHHSGFFPNDLENPFSIVHLKFVKHPTIGPNNNNNG